MTIFSFSVVVAKLPDFLRRARVLLRDHERARARSHLPLVATGVTAARRRANVETSCCVSRIQRRAYKF